MRKTSTDGPVTAHSFKAPPAESPLNPSGPRPANPATGRPTPLGASTRSRAFPPRPGRSWLPYPVGRAPRPHPRITRRCSGRACGRAGGGQRQRRAWVPWRWLLSCFGSAHLAPMYASSSSSASFLSSSCRAPLAPQPTPPARTPRHPGFRPAAGSTARPAPRTPPPRAMHRAKLQRSTPNGRETVRAALDGTCFLCQKAIISLCVFSSTAASRCGAPAQPTRISPRPRRPTRGPCPAQARPGARCR